MVDRQLRVAHPPKSGVKLRQKLAITDSTGEVLSLQYDHDDKYLAVAYGNGEIKVYNAFTGKLGFTMATGQHDVMPFTSVRWRPQIAGDAKSSSVLVTTSSDGVIQHWHMNTGKCQHTLKEENGNNLYALDFSLDGRQFAVAGMDTHVYVYDEVTKQRTHDMHIGGKNLPGHSNRVFTVKYHPQDQNVVLSGGWDKTIQIYDLREGRTVASIFGPNISGDALDVYDDMIVTGSNRNKEIVQLFSYSKRSLIHNIDWEATSRKDFEAGYVFATRFSKPNPNLIIAGGAGKNEVKVIENNADGSATFKIQGAIHELETPCLALDTAKQGDVFAFGCQDGKIYVFGYKIEEGDFEGYQGGMMKEASDKHKHDEHEEDEERKE